jgi:hypothetical protein
VIDVKVTMGFLVGVLAMYLYMKWCEKKMGA